MVIDSANALVAAIRAAGLLDAAQLRHLETSLQERFPAPVDLARHLMHANWLTPYQVNQVLQGNGATLRLGPYILLERLGAGGMGEVFKARHRLLERVNAIKVIRKARLAYPNALARFRREVEAAAQLSHPNIVAVYDAGEEQEVHYLAMELIEGIDLGKLVQQCGPLPVRQACEYARQAALGLHHAHERGLIHRDVKPQNLLVTGKAPAPTPTGRQPLVRAETYATGTVKVLDMGLVGFESAAGEQSEGALTQLGAVIGTVDYLAPEQAKNSRRIDRRADLYSLGCTLFHLLAGQPPFAGGAAMDKLLKHQIDAPPPLAEYRADVPTEVAAIVERLLAKRPEQRHNSAEELAVALAAILPACSDAPPVPVVAGNGEAISDGTVKALEPTDILVPSHFLTLETKGAAQPPNEQEQPPRPPRRRPRPKRRRWWVAALAGLAICSLVAVAVIALSQQAAEPSAPPPKPGGHLKPGPPPGKIDGLADYLPPNCAGVLALNVKQFLTSEGRRKQGPLVVEPGLRRVLGLLGIVPERDVEWARVYFRAGPDRRPLVLGRGKIDRTRFKLGNWGWLEPSTADDLPLHYKLRGKVGTATLFVGVTAPYVLVSEDQKSVIAGLNQIEQRAPDEQHPLRPLLAKVDREQTAWLVLDAKRLGPVKAAALRRLQLDVIRRTATEVYGGITCDKGMRGNFVLTAGDERRAARLERALGAARDFLRDHSEEVALDKDRKTLVNLLATATITRTGNVLTVRCHRPWSAVGAARAGKR